LTKPEEPARIGSFRPILGAAVLLFVAVLAMAGTKSYRDLEAARQRRQRLENQIEMTQEEIARLRGRIDSLRSDPGTLERLAREDLGMVRPGDVVIELPQDPAAPPRARTVRTTVPAVPPAPPTTVPVAVPVAVPVHP
jgi:cell division protein FtsB